MTTQHEIIANERFPRARRSSQETSALIADPQVRYMGTLGGNAANGDPGNDMPAVMMALGASYVLRGPAASAASRRATIIRASTTPPLSRAKSSPRSAFLRRRPATATPTKS